MKKLLVLTLIGFSAAVSYAAEIYWMVNSEKATAYTTLDWKFAQLVAIKDGAYSHETGGKVLAALSKDDVVAGAVGIIENAETYASGYSFIVELVTSAGYGDKVSWTKRYGVSDAIAYENLAYTGGLSRPSTAYSMGDAGFNAVPIPEPSSGLLLTLGMVALGLKRKKERC